MCLPESHPTQIMRFFICLHVCRLAITRFQEIGSKFGILWVAGDDLVAFGWRDENRMGFRFLFPRRIRTFAAGMSSSSRIQLLSLKKQTRRSRQRPMNDETFTTRSAREMTSQFRFVKLRLNGFRLIIGSTMNNWFNKSCRIKTFRPLPAARRIARKFEAFRGDDKAFGKKN